MTKADLNSVDSMKNIQYTHNLISDTLENLTKRLTDLTIKVNTLDKVFESFRTIIQQQDVEINDFKSSQLQKGTINNALTSDFTPIKEYFALVMNKFEILGQTTINEVEQLRKQNIETRNYVEIKIQELETQLKDIQRVHPNSTLNLEPFEYKKTASEDKRSIIRLEVGNTLQNSSSKEQQYGTEPGELLQTAIQEIVFLKTQIIELTNEKNASEKEIQTYTNQISKLNTLVQELLKKIEELESQKVLFKENSSTDEQINTIKREKLEKDLLLLSIPIKTLNRFSKEVKLSEKDISTGIEQEQNNGQNNMFEKENMHPVKEHADQSNIDDIENFFDQHEIRRNQTKQDQEKTSLTLIPTETDSIDLNKELTLIDEKYLDKILELERIVTTQKLQLEETQKNQEEFKKLNDWKNRVEELENALMAKENSLNAQKVEIEALKSKQEVLDDIDAWKNRVQELENILTNREQVIGNLKIKLEDLERNQNVSEHWQIWKDRVAVLENTLSNRDKIINDQKIEIEINNNKIQLLEEKIAHTTVQITDHELHDDEPVSKLTNVAVIEDLRMQVVELENLLVKTQTELVQTKKDLAMRRYTTNRNNLAVEQDLEVNKEIISLNEYSSQELSIEEYEKQLKVLQKEIISLENDLEDSDDELEEMEEQITKLKETNEFLKTELETKEKLFENRTTQLEIMANEFEVLRNQLETTDNVKTIEELKETLKLTESALQQANTQVLQATEQINTEEELQRVLSEKDKQIDTIHMQLKTAEVRLGELEKNSIQDKKRIKALKTALVQVKKENLKLKSKIE